MSDLRATLRQWVVGSLSNCGGINLRGARYAGHLAKGTDLSTEQVLGIGHSLIFPNGVRKTTSPSRNRAVVESVLATGVLGPRRPLRVLDIGASFGLDAGGTQAALAKEYDVREYVLGDLFTRIFVDDDRGLVFDEDGALLQVRSPLGFVSVHFSYDFPWQRWLNMPKQLLPKLLARRYRFDPTRPLREAPLVLSALRVDEPGSPFRLLRMNVFSPPGDERFDFIICMHLLVERYFDEETRERGRTALAAMLNPGGVLVVGAAESFVVVVNEAGTFRRIASTEILDR